MEADLFIFIKERRDNMKVIFNDASEMMIQSADIRVDGSLLIKTISVTEDELRSTFQDTFRTKKMVMRM